MQSKTMHINNFAILSGIILLNMALPVLARDKNNCEINEKVYFSCDIKSGKTISLCGNVNSNANPVDLTYRFGRDNKIELIFPESKKGSLEKFNYNHYFRYQTDYLSVGFVNGKYSYGIYKNYDGSISKNAEYGITIGAADGLGNETRIVCTGSSVVDRLWTLPKVLACNPDSALGCEH